MLETCTDDDHNNDDGDDDDDDDDVDDGDDAVSKKDTSSKTEKRTKARVTWSEWFSKEAHLEKHYHELIMLFTPWWNEKLI